MPKNVDMKLRANGISAVGETDLLLKYGKFGNSSKTCSRNIVKHLKKRISFSSSLRIAHENQ